MPALYFGDYMILGKASLTVKGTGNIEKRELRERSYVLKKVNHLRYEILPFGVVSRLVV